MSALRELIAFFGVEVDDKKLDHSAEKMNRLGELAIRAGETIGLAFGLHEIGEFIAQQVELGNQVLNTAEMLGVAANELKEFRYAAYQADVSAEEADTALRFLNKNMGEAANGAGTAAATFAKLGVKMKDQEGKTRPAIDVLADLADGISDLDDPAKETATAMELFGRAGAKLIPLLHKGSKGIEELSAEFRDLTEGAAGPSIEMLEEAEHQQKRLETASKGLKAVVAAELIPAFTSFVSWVTDLVKGFRQFAANSYIVQTALGTLAAISIVLMGIWAVMNIEVLLVVAGIALLILIIDDVYTAMKGGKSVIGDFIDSIFGIGTTKVVFDQLTEWAYAAYDMIRKIATGIKAAINGAAQLTNEIVHAVSSNSKTEDNRYERVKKELEGELFDLKDKYDEIATTRRAKSTTIGRPGPGEDTNGQPDYMIGPPVAPKARHPIASLVGNDAIKAPTGTVAAPGAGGVVHNGDIIKKNDVTVSVTGGSDAKDTGKAVQAAVLQAIKEDENESAYAALPSGGGF